MSSNLRAENRRNRRNERNEARREAINRRQNERNEARREAINRRQNERNEARREEINRRENESNEARREEVNRRQNERNEARREEVNRRQNERNEARRVLFRRGMHCIARSNVFIKSNYLGEMNHNCQYCDAKNFLNETHFLCCNSGKVVLPPLSPYPPLMFDLMTGNHVDRALNQNFFKHIRNFNACLFFASFIATIDPPSNRGPPCFRISRQIMHRIGNLRHQQGDPPAYCQLYVYDPNTVLNFRMEKNDCCIRELMELLQTIINQENPYALAFKNMAEVEDAEIRQAAIDGRPISVVKMSLFEGCDRRRYNLPSHEEVAIVFVGNDGAPPPFREVVIYPRGQLLKTISSMSANLDPMIYPIFFPRGDAGWHDQLEHNPDRATRVRNRVTLSQYYNYRLSIRQTFSPIFYGKKLFQQHAVDAYVKIEGQRLAFIRNNQNKLRSEQYDTLHEYVNNVANNLNVRPGCVVILPSSYVGSPRALKENFEDAMAIIKKYGKPDLFITFTCYSKWREITENLNPGESATDRPDLVCRVFEMKLKCFLGDIFKHGLRQSCKSCTDQTVDPELFEIVKTCMIHGPCGILNRNFTCMKDGVCTKKFPKEFNPCTVAIFNGYPNYRRLDNGRVVIIKSNQGHDCANVVINESVDHDEINTYLDCHFVSAPEALWEIYEYSISDMSHTIIRLQIHLPDNQRVYFNEGEEQVAIDRAAQRDTHLTAWFKLNDENNEARQYSYVEIPYHFVFGAKSFEDLRTVHGTVFNTFREACYHLADYNLPALDQFLDNVPENDDEDVQVFIDEANRVRPLLNDNQRNVADAILAALGVEPTIFGGAKEADYAKRAILTPTNVDSLAINEELLHRLPGDVKTYLSSDSIDTDDLNEINNFPVEFLNSLTPSGMPVHCLKIKIGAVIMLLRNLDVKGGLCNGTRLMVRALHNNYTNGEVLTGVSAGNRVFVPRVQLAPSDANLPFTLKRRQFPDRLAYSMTINKNQGQTFEKVGVYLKKSCFSHGQLYVACSRTRSFNSLFFKVDKHPLQESTKLNGVVPSEVIPPKTITDCGCPEREAILPFIKGPSIDPCGTPQLIDSNGEHVKSNGTTCLRFST
ncbi:uncharacterized protein LOC136073944 [Hydra vulgaris]|uniref:uncharacterized protein LOC136073944 n=1 Tax=Hydra vulgaris TaxID=6087 RepID=UPI0032EA1B85